MITIRALSHEPLNSATKSQSKRLNRAIVYKRIGADRVARLNRSCERGVCFMLFQINEKFQKGARKQLDGRNRAD